jgi:fatty acid desaturase
MNDQLRDSVRHARREAVFVAVLWCAAAVYTIAYCAAFGYGRSAQDLRFVFGIPDWVFWGIVTPWTVCLAIGCWFSWFYMTDEPLGADEEQNHDAVGAEESSHHG